MRISKKRQSFRALPAFCFIAVIAFVLCGGGYSAEEMGTVQFSAPPIQDLKGENRTVPDLFHLGRLYKDHRYFELRDAVKSMRGTSSREFEFYKGAVDNIFNRIDSAIAHLWNYLDSAQAAVAAAGLPAGRDLALEKEAWILLADSYWRSGRFRKSAEAQRVILERFGTTLDAGEKTNRESQAILWSALADSPPQSVDIPKDSSISMENGQFPIRIKDRTYYFAYDTGASLSVLYLSAATELGLALLGQGAKIQSATGRWIESKLAVVPELQLGEAVIRNAAFLVLPDDFFPVRRVREGVERRGLIGVPILTALKEISETRDGILIIPASPDTRPLENMCFFGSKPITEIGHRGARLLFCVDTGSSRTFLYPPFFRRYQEEIESRTNPVPVKMGGVGGERTVTMRILDGFTFQAGGRDLALRKVDLHIEVTNSNSEIFDGVIGRDVLKQCSRMTFNFESMSFVLE